MDWKLTCRVCLEGGDMVSMFDCDENNELLRDKYKYTTDIEVTESDTLPTLICLTCVDRLLFAYQFKQQCIASNDTLKECFMELSNSNVPVLSGKTNDASSEVVTLKQENGVYLQYELPIERAGGLKVQGFTPATPKCRRGRLKKHSNQEGEISKSSSHSKESPVKEEKPSLSAILVSEEIDLKGEHHGDGDLDYLQDGDDDEDVDPDYEPWDHSAADEEPSIAPALAPKKRRRPAKKPRGYEEEEDVLLKETIMAYSEPLPDSILKLKDSKPKNSILTPKKPKPRKRHKKDNTSHMCETCGKSFTTKQSLEAHIRRHLGIKPFVCSVCGVSFVLNMELRLHMMRHTGHKHYKCRICEQRFGDCGSRQRHERLHFEGRPYHCTVCDKSFSYRNVLNRHLFTHTGEKKFACGSCNKKFTLAYQLKHHNKLHHKDVYLKQQKEEEAKRIKMKDVSKAFASVQFLEGEDSVQMEGESDETQLHVVEDGKTEEVEAEDTGSSKGD